MVIMHKYQKEVNKNSIHIRINSLKVLFSGFGLLHLFDANPYFQRYILAGFYLEDFFCCLMTQGMDSGRIKRLMGGVGN